MPLVEVRLFCSVCKVNSIPAPEGATEKTKYKCSTCSVGEEPEDRAKALAFDRFQFNGLTEDSFRAQLKPRPDAPGWVFDNELVLKVSNGHTQSREMTARRAATIYLYFRCSWECEQIGETLGISEDAVRVSIQRLSERGEKLALRETS